MSKAGLDRKAIRDYVASTTHKTIIGDIKFTGSENVGTPGTVSQWQNGEFEVVWPQKVATAQAESRDQAGLEVTANAVPAHMSLGAWLELLASGLITGGIYALVALGLNLQYGLMRILNIAHGEFLMVGAYLTWMAQTSLGLSPLLMVPVSFVVLMALGLADPLAVLPAAHRAPRPTSTSSRRAA